MNLTSVKPGDIVRVNKKGRIFHAVVSDKANRELRLRPIESNITWFTATSREIEMAWHKSRLGSRAKSNGGTTDESALHSEP